MSTPDVTVPALNDQQATGILTEALNRRMMEGGIPPDEATRLSYAQQLVSQAKLAWDAGNHDENVMAVLFIAEVEMNPQVAAAVAPSAQPIEPPAPAPPIAAPPAVPAEPSTFDIATLGDDTITRMIQTLQGPEYADNPKVQAELAQLQAEQNRRQGGASAQAPQTQAVPPQAPPAPPAAPPPTMPPPPAAAPIPPPGAPTLTPPPAIAGGVPGAQPPVFPPGPVAPNAQPDAGAQAQAAPTQQEAAQAPPVTEDGERAALQGQLTIAALRAHGIDPAEAGTLSIESLRFVVENPGGPVASTTTATQPDPESPVSSAREQLVEQITGPMLKAYGRGRRDIPGIGDNEIMLMIQNPDGKIDPAQLSAARAADAASQPVDAGAVAAMAPPQPPTQPVPVAPPVPNQVPPQAPPQQMQPPPQSAFAPSAAVDAAVAQSPAQAPPQAPPLTPQPPTGPPGAAAFSPVAAAAGQPAFSPPAPGTPPTAAASPGMAIPAPGGSIAQEPPLAPPAGAPPVTANAAQEKAMAIISAENMPIPPEIEGTPPRLPNDLSKSGDQELFSYHAQFHACEVRMNWVISQREDELGDARKLLRDQRRKVLLAIPSTVDGKKVTKEIKEAMAEDDAQVQQFRAQVEEVEEVIGKLRVLRDGYHQDVSTCSRQWSMRSGEADKQPR